MSTMNRSKLILREIEESIKLSASPRAPTATMKQSVVLRQRSNFA